MMDGTADEVLVVLRREFGPLDVKEIAARSGIGLREVGAVIEELADGGFVVRDGDMACIPEAMAGDVGGGPEPENAPEMTGNAPLASGLPGSLAELLAMTGDRLRVTAEVEWICEGGDVVGVVVRRIGKIERDG